VPRTVIHMFSNISFFRGPRQNSSITLVTCACWASAVAPLWRSRGSRGAQERAGAVEGAGRPTAGQSPKSQKPSFHNTNICTVQVAHVPHKRSVRACYVGAACQ
jgi:hypothetical protein